MLARAHTFTIEGLHTRHVTVEVDIRRGLPAFAIVGLADAAVREARERVQTAVDPGEGAEDPAEDDAAQQVEQVPRVERELHTHGQREQPDASDDLLADALRKAVAEDGPEDPADEHGRGVEQGPGERGQCAA